jgi:hypothetical protein
MVTATELFECPDLIPLLFLFVGLDESEVYEIKVDERQ